MLYVLPPGDFKAMSCDGCMSGSFEILTESRDGQIDAFHTRCTNCGKRGYLVNDVKVKTERSFVQFVDPPPVTVTEIRSITETTVGHVLGRSHDSRPAK